jgi:RecA/RadA recombinase
VRRAVGQSAIPSKSAPAEKVSQWAKLSKEFAADGLGQASEVLRDVRAVPTIFVQLDQMLGVGGWPTDRFGLIHGESNGGKTELALGLILSFLMRDHAALLIDAEHTTPVSWVRKLMGSYATHPGFTALYPRTYEKTVDDVRAWCTRIGDAKAHGKLDRDSTGIIIVDSLRKLVPAKLLDRLMKEGAAEAEDDGHAVKSGRFKKGPRGVDGYGGRAAQFKAALNAQWVDELTPLLFQTGTCLVAIAREMEVPDGAGMMSFGNVDDVKVGGGKSVYFESSVVLRVTNGATVANEAGILIAEAHRVSLRKTKVAEKLVRRPEAHFYTSTGVANPYGFDRPRDLVELATQLGSMDQAGSSYVFSGPVGGGHVIGHLLGRGLEGTIKELYEQPELFEAIDLATRRMFMPAATEEAPERQAPLPINRKRRAPVTKKAIKKRRLSKRDAKKRMAS